MNTNEFTNYCIDNLNLNEQDQYEQYFSSVSICAFDAIYSINSNYKAVQNALHKFCEHFNLTLQHPKIGEIPPKDKQYSNSVILDKIKNIDPKKLASDIFENKQRTSSTNGILKAEAGIQFLKILNNFNIEFYQDIPKLIDNTAFESEIRNIRGQGSGISLKYFFMLTGSKDLIKPDRMVISFINDAIEKTLSPENALILVKETVKELNKKGYPNLSPRHLDNLMWNFQRIKNKGGSKI